jgi:hypothetical protein
MLMAMAMVTVTVLPIRSKLPETGDAAGQLSPASEPSLTTRVALQPPALAQPVAS